LEVQASFSDKLKVFQSSPYWMYAFMPQMPSPSVISKRMKPSSPHPLLQEFWIFQ